jgi:predicted P-loop ATPase
MRRADVEHVKSFASRQTDNARAAYGRVVEHRPRRSVEWATTNNREYLQSQTGNRRFAPLLTGDIDLDALRTDRLQLLGEAAAAESAGESLVIDETLWGAGRVEQEARRVRDPWEDLLSRIPEQVVTPGGFKVSIIHRDPSGTERVATADLLEHVCQVPVGHMVTTHGQRLAHAMALAGWRRNKSGQVMIAGRSVRGYLRSGDQGGLDLDPMGDAA